MLQKIREKVTGWIAGIILALLAIVFAVWGIDIGFSTRTTAAVVNGDEIPIAPVRQAIQTQVSRLAQQLGSELPELLEAQVRDSVIEDFVRQRVLLQRIREQGYRISDEELSRQISEMPVFQVGGQFSLDSYRAMLANYGMTPTAFEAEQRQYLEIGQLQDGILKSAFTTVDELERRVRLDREQREIEWLRLPVDAYMDQVTVTDEQILAEYEAAPDRYQSRETVDVEYLELDLRTIAGEATVTEEDLRRHYEEQVSREPDLFSTPEQRRARHILVSIDDDSDESAAEAEALALLERVRSGEAFADVAREASDDSGSASLGGNLDWVEPGMMVAPFEDALFSMEDGEIRGPVRSPFGFHLILLEETRAGETRGFEEVRAQLDEELRGRQAEDAYYERAETMERLAFENPDTLIPAADALGIEVQTITGVTRMGNTGIAAEPEFARLVFSTEVLDDRENSAALELEEGRAVVLRVAEYYPAELLPLEDVRSDIVLRLEREAAQALAEEAAAELRRQIEAGAAAAELAGDVGAEHQSRRLVGREDNAVPQAVRAALFAASLTDESPVVETVALADGSRVVFVLTGIVPGDADDMPVAERKSLREQIIRSSGGEEISAYLGQIRSEASVVVSTEQFE